MFDRAASNEERRSWTVFYEQMQMDEGVELARKSAAAWWGLCKMRESGQAPTLH